MSWDVSAKLTIDNKHGYSLPRIAWEMSYHFLEACKHIQFAIARVNSKSNSLRELGLSSKTFPHSFLEWEELLAEYYRKKAKKKKAIMPPLEEIMVMLGFHTLRYCSEDNELWEVEGGYTDLRVNYNNFKEKEVIQAAYYAGTSQFLSGIDDADDFNYELLEKEFVALTPMASSLAGHGPDGINAVFKPLSNENDFESHDGKINKLDNGVLLFSKDFPKGKIKDEFL